MAFTRSFLKSVGLTEEQVQAVMDEHVGVTDALKQQRDGFKAEADKLPAMRKSLEALEAEKGYRKMYEDEHTAHEALKQRIADEAESAKVKAAYRRMLSEEKISEKHLDAVLRATDFSSIRLDAEGKLENEPELRESAKREWGDFIVTTTQRGAPVPTPPVTGSAKLTRQDIFKRDEHGRYVLSTEERQRAIAENPQAFQ